MKRRVAALFVEKAPVGIYQGLTGVECWDLSTPEKDARIYEGPHPVVAHPPCARWGPYWYGGPMLHIQGRRKRLGDDGGCFAAALRAVRTYGGVLEHPAYSAAWRWFNLVAPHPSGGWIQADWTIGCRGFTCHVEQGNYGHLARKATWLYAVGTDLPSLRWERSVGKRLLGDGYHSARERAEGKAANRQTERLSNHLRQATPVPFRDLLLEMARSVREA